MILYRSQYPSVLQIVWVAVLPSSSLKVLVIDNSGPMRDLLRSLLSTSGLGQAFEAADGPEAVEKIRDIKPDVVVCSLAMRPMDGAVFTRHIRWDENSPNPYQPIIVIVGQNEHARLAEVRDAGVTAILTRPVSAQSLLSHIVEIVEHPRPYIRVGTYFGPDRRQRIRQEAAVPHRRSEDIAEIATKR